MISWFDRTHVTGNGRHTLQPYMMTSAIFTEKFCRLLKSWFIIGYMPKYEASSAEKVTLEQGQALRDYHKQIEGFLKTYMESPIHLRNVLLPIGPTGEMRVDIICPYLYQIRDMEEADKSTGRFKPHTNKIQRQCRACDVDFKGMGKPHVRCNFVTANAMAKIATSSDPVLRQRWSMHKLDNIYHRIHFMDPVRGVYGATPSDLLHCVRSGPMKVCNKLILDEISPLGKKKLDNMARNFHKNNRQTYRKAYPTTDFTNGITNLTNITADEHVGMMFLFVILSHFDDGWNLLSTVLKRNTNTNTEEVMELFEGILCYEAWLSQTSQWQLTNATKAKQAAMKSVRKLMFMCVQRLPRVKGNGWCIPKFHEWLHFVEDMSRFGAAPNFCAQRPESLFKDAAKKPGARPYV